MKIRCTDCKRFARSTGWCRPQRAKVNHPRHWRQCAFYLGPQPIRDIRASLEASGLAHHVAELRDTDEGRLLRLVAGVPTAQRFAIYRMAGLGVEEPRRVDLRRRESAGASAGAGTGSRRAA